MQCNAEQMAKFLKCKQKVILLTGALSEKIRFSDGSSLLDYAVRVSNALGASVGATGNTLRLLKGKDANLTGTKQWFIEVINQLSSPFSGPLLEVKPDCILCIGYPAGVMNSFLPSIKGIETAYLGIRDIPSATAAPPDMGITELQRYLDELLQALV